MNKYQHMHQHILHMQMSTLIKVGGQRGQGGAGRPHTHAGRRPLFTLRLSLHSFPPLPFFSLETLLHSQCQLRVSFHQLTLLIREEKKREKKYQGHQLEIPSSLSFISLIFEFLCSCCSCFCSSCS